MCGINQDRWSLRMGKECHGGISSGGSGSSLGCLLFHEERLRRLTSTIMACYG